MTDHTKALADALRETDKELGSISEVPVQYEVASALDIARDTIKKALAAYDAAPDKYCLTREDGECISTDPRCMHQPPRAENGELVERLRAAGSAKVTIKIEDAQLIVDLRALVREAADALSRAPQPDTVTEEMVEAHAREMCWQAELRKRKFFGGENDGCKCKGPGDCWEWNTEADTDDARAALTTALAVRGK